MVSGSFLARPGLKATCRASSLAVLGKELMTNFVPPLMKPKPTVLSFSWWTVRPQSQLAIALWMLSGPGGRAGAYFGNFKVLYPQLQKARTETGDSPQVKQPEPDRLAAHGVSSSPNKVMESSPHARRLIDTLRQSLNSSCRPDWFRRCDSQTGSCSSRLRIFPKSITAPPANAGDSTNAAIERFVFKAAHLVADKGEYAGGLWGKGQRKGQIGHGHLM